MTDLEIELMSHRVQTWMLREFNELASVMDIEDVLTTVAEPELEADIRAYRERGMAAYNSTQTGDNRSTRAWSELSQAERNKWNDRANAVETKSKPALIAPVREVPVNYAVLQMFADRNGVSYNELCTTVRLSLAATEHLTMSQFATRAALDAALVAQDGAK